MLPLHKGNNFEPEIMICGGGQAQALDTSTDERCGRLKPMAQNPEWKMTTMLTGRVMVEGVLLLDGTVLWINGAEWGAQGFGLAKEPTLEALVYDPRTQSWSASGKSSIARLYHSVALLLLDGTVLITGSNPNPMPILQGDVDINTPSRAYPTDFRVEIWTPPYLRGEKASKRPGKIELSTRELKLGASFSIDFDVQTDGLKTLDVILYAGGFVTHSVHMGQVLVYLENGGWEAISNRRKRVKARIPDIKLAPGPYVVYVVADGVPGIGQFVTLSV